MFLGVWGICYIEEHIILYIKFEILLFQDEYSQSFVKEQKKLNAITHLALFTS